MRQLSANGQRQVEDIASRHGFSLEATLHLLDAVRRGSGGMAQFSHPEFGGPGQWMRGGMTMVSDMFNHGMKARVDAVCGDLAELVATEPDLARAGSFQSQQQGSATPLFQTRTHATGDASDQWWPETLGQPASVGAQNNARYAYFPQRQRLAIDTGSGVTVYDTGHHDIGGFSQQQSSGGTVSFSSQHGPVDLASLPVVLGARSPARGSVESDEAGAASTAGSAAALPALPALPERAEIFDTIERLGALKEKGLLSEEEFAAKKAELLARL